MHNENLNFSRLLKISAAVISALSLGVSGEVRATVITPISAVGSSSYASYPASDTIDTGANRFVTDWAANGTGIGSYLNVDLGGVFTLANALLTDRTTSGANNGAFAGGTSDFTTQFSIKTYTDGTFTTTVGPALTFTKAAPSSPTSTAQFLYTALLGGISAEFLRYTVIAASGANPGLADIEFTTVDEPASLALLGGGLIVIAVLRRRALQRSNDIMPANLASASQRQILY